MQVIKQEFNEVKQSEVNSFLGAVHNNGIWIVSLRGPEKTALQAHTYELEFEFPGDYPQNPPQVTVKESSSTFFKPGSQIDLPILKQDWTPFFKVSNILSNIQAFFIQNYSVNESQITDQIQVSSDIVRHASYKTQIPQHPFNKKQSLNKPSSSVKFIDSPRSKSSSVKPKKQCVSVCSPTLSFLKKYIDQITSQCRSLQQLLTQSQLTIVKNSLTKQIQDLTDLKNSLWSEFFSQYKEGIIKQFNLKLD